ncbi:MAG: HNH endonuclease [Niveispirillum sp.]|uniref:HNH endonuclease n=1 Tax=Niveispirillum sp. TaxID=1917217 RepID=UPI0040355B29
METKPIEKEIFSEGLSAYVSQDLDRWRECRDSSFFARATRMVKHPSRSRQLRRIRETKSPRMALLLKVLFGGDSYAKCPRCQWTKSREDAFFGHRKDGRWRNVCRTCDAEAVRSWQKRNPDKVKDQQALRRRRIADAPGEGMAHWKKKFIRRSCGGRCAYCDQAVPEGKEEWDHMTPICDGGANTPSNITLSCSHCNRRKGGCTAEDYIDRRARFGQPTRNWPPGRAPWELRSFKAFTIRRGLPETD